ncbi:ARM repeat-containing protein [Moesziomyces antarcticus]|uniref:ARM repeat-containing protein n=2 Tax=Pseudozyma antarctica TaxID=84753 RepID=A0A081CP30_PSEA2|nr:ARM repeat-containing protein [Moesziomyces antarcticus]GAK68426.1 ARM repeat-containing protein [Moesziomyces antarcticus]SPO45281.1 uncharacterized protein PSANT_02967 [Moesziomyces antarcticus]
MPKSGFDPQRHQRKLHRHNPLAKSSASSSAAASPASVASSTLDALQQAAKGAGADTSSPKSSKAAKAASNAAATNDIIPLLANLPAPDAPSASPINLADKVWALASVSLLLSVSPTQSAAEVKLHRKLLLSHNLVGRLILALHSHTEVDVRREASGALRNLCVDAGIDVRNELVNKGGIPAILAALRWASNALGFDAAPAASANPSISFVDDAPTQEQDIEAKRALLAKPLDKMNKKEKRHATKLATALGKTLEQLAGQGLSADDEAKLTASHQPSNGSSDQVMDTASSVAPAAVRAAEPFLSLDSNTRKGLVEMADNLVTLVWSLCESGDKAFAKLVSWKWLDHDIVGAAAANDELSGEGLASWLSSAIALGSRAAAVLSTAGADGSRASSSSAHDAADALGVLSNEELSLLLDLALASGNALCALTDGGEADFVDGLLSRKMPAHIPKAAKKKAASVSIDVRVVQSIDEQPEAATRRLAAIQTAVTLLEACVQTDQSGIDKLKRYILSQSTMLGVLCAGVLRNVAAAVDSHASTRSSGKARKNAAAAAFSSDNVFLPASSGAGVASKSEKGKLDASQGVSLKRFEEATVLPTLTRLLAGVDMTRLAHDLDGRGDVGDVSLDGSKDADEAAVRAKMQRKAEEQAQTLMLALEVVAEMAGSLDARAGADGDEGEWLEDLDAEDAGDEDMDMGDEDDDVPEDMEAMLNDEAGDDDMRVDAEQKDTFADAVKRSGSMPFEAYAPVLCAIFGDASSLTDALLALARPFEASFPSLSSGAKSADADATTSGQLRGLHLRSLSVLNNLMLRLASFSPPPPSQPATEPKLQRRIAALRAWTQQPTPARTLGSVWTSLFDIAKGCASVPAVAGAGAGAIVEDGVVGSIGSADGREVGEGEGGDGMAMVETCIGTMWSVARIVEGNVALSAEPAVRVTDAGAVSSEVVSALVAGYASARSDAMRVKCVLLLSTIARAPAVHANLNAHIGNWLVSLLEAIPERGSAGTTPESMVAAINGLIDVYADETATYDAHGFREQGLLARMRLTLFRCKALARTIDRRKQISLRASAEEALENLAGFIQYRQSLGL